MSLTRRIDRLEAAQPPPPPAGSAGDGDDGAWWRAAPPAVLTYYAAIWGEVEADARFPADPDAAIGAVHARHPALGDVQLWVGLWGRRGAAFTLRQVQRAVLDAARSRLAFAIAAAERCGHDPQNDERTYRRMLGIPDCRVGEPPDPARPTGSDCYYDRTGETFVRAWRATGTRDPATLALLGLQAAELALLAADEAPA